MAAYTLVAGERGAYAKSLAAGVVDTVTFAQDVSVLEVWGDGTAAVYFTVDGSVPVVGGGGTFELPAGGASVRTVGASGASAPVVKLISGGTPKYSVAGDV